MVIRGQVSEVMAKSITFMLAAFVVLATCQLKMTHVNVYPYFGPSYGDGGSGH
jgi:uncharacterized lipoprotein YajG